MVKCLATHMYTYVAYMHNILSFTNSMMPMPSAIFSIQPCKTPVGDYKPLIPLRSGNFLMKIRNYFVRTRSTHDLYPLLLSLSLVMKVRLCKKIVFVQET